MPSTIDRPFTSAVRTDLSTPDPSAVRNPPAIDEQHPGAAGEDAMASAHASTQYNIDNFDIDNFDINNFEIDRSEIYFHNVVPKLKGQSNFRDWETGLLLGLSANNEYYARMLTHGIPIPSAPFYYNTSVDAVRAELLEAAKAVSGEDTDDIVITSSQVHTRTIELEEINAQRKEKYDSQRNNWRTCNSRTLLNLRKTLGIEAISLIAQITDAREVYQKLRKTYASPSHQQSYDCYAKWVDLRYKNGSASNFVRKFQEALREVTATSGAPSQMLELCQFKRAIFENPRCAAFLQNLRVNEEDPDWMDEVYFEFIETETHNRLVNAAWRERE
ncbi:hypothetical protein N7516_009851 [Penicillium verrucosum]|uniref:uncharacterized protein n=1 Tax=Penicillium verrucosum TaxID=60171 RepID=UPI002544FE70|nr:uncharacterized protein N7516_009851 [Penicillium verrucosum]KAJ5922148.1 hypothetical protein N7516_009851 [Penicillium verrucosum]